MDEECGMSATDGYWADAMYRCTRHKNHDGRHGTIVAWDEHGGGFESINELEKALY